MTCLVDGCPKTRWARGYCGTHYRRWARHGAVGSVERLPNSLPIPLEHRFALKFSVDDSGCWLWHGSITPKGYGQIRADGRLQNAHRVAYELSVGPIPDGLEIDHLCRVRHCVNPDHLEPVTHTENVRRSVRSVA